jgi:hypothetical protein
MLFFHVQPASRLIIIGVGFAVDVLDLHDLEDSFPRVAVESYHYFSQTKVLFVTFTYLRTDFLTSSMEQSPPLEAKRFSASHEIPAFYGTRRFITAFTNARQLHLS